MEVPPMILRDCRVENATETHLWSSVGNAIRETQGVSDRMARYSATQARCDRESGRFQRMRAANRRIGAVGRFTFRVADRRWWRRQSSRSEEHRAAAADPLHQPAAAPVCKVPHTNSESFANLGRFSGETTKRR